jgi:hypothetical protein
VSTYTQSKSFTGLGLVLSIGTNNSPIVYTQVGEVKSVAGPDLKAETADVTNVQSPGGVKEFLPTLVDPGELSFPVNYVPTDPGQEAVYNALVASPKVRLPFELALPVSSIQTPGFTHAGYWTFTGLVVGFAIETPYDKEATVTIKIKLSGLPTYNQESA